MEMAYKAQVRKIKTKSICFFAICLILSIILEVFGMGSFFDTRSDRIDFVSINEKIYCLNYL